VVVVTAFGCIIAAAGEIKFAMIGFMCQVAAVVVSLNKQPTAVIADRIGRGNQACPSSNHS
jgi:hypothetical protein